MPKSAFRFFLPAAAMASCLAANAGSANAIGPNIAPSAIRAMGSLSAAERLRLPDSTPVELAGRRLTLGTIRREHDRRMSRLAHAVPLSALLPHRSYGPINGVNLAGSSTPPAPVPTPPTAPLLVPASYYGQFANDYQAACGPSGWIGSDVPCLYMPAEVTLDVVGRFAYDVDPLIFDATLCQSGGGSLQSTGCFYKYPLDMVVNFTPPLFATNDGWNASTNYTHAVDPRGAVELKMSPMPANGSWYYTGPGSGCSLRAQILLSSASSVRAQ